MKNLYCVSCGIPLKGRQRRFCSRKCRNTYTNHNHQTYLLQQERGRKRKILLIKELGGACSRCGYNKNFAALDFHHTGNKNGQLDLRSLSNHSMEWIRTELKECILLCANCHREDHNPQCFLYPYLTPRN